MNLSSKYLIRCAYEQPSIWEKSRQNLSLAQQEAVEILRKVNDPENLFEVGFMTLGVIDGYHKIFSHIPDSYKQKAQKLVEIGPPQGGAPFYLPFFPNAEYVMVDRELGFLKDAAERTKKYCQRDATIIHKDVESKPLKLNADVVIDFRAATFFSPFFTIARNLLDTTKQNGYLVLFPGFLKKEVCGKQLDFGPNVLELILEDGSRIRTYDDIENREHPTFTKRLKYRLELRKMKKELEKIGLKDVNTILTYVGFGFIGQKKV